MITYCPTSQLNKNLKDKQNEFLPFPVTPPLESPAIDLNLSNTPNSLKKMHKPLFSAIYLLEIPTIESK